VLSFRRSGVGGILLFSYTYQDVNLGVGDQGPGVRDGLILMPEEKDFFDLLGLDWIEPEARGTQ